MRVTLNDISEATGYEVSTVSKVLRCDKRCYASEETRKIIFDAATLLDYVPNHFVRSLRSRRSHTIGIVGAFAEGVRWLPECGHARTAFMYANEEGATANPRGSTLPKMTGYRAAMEERGIFDEGLLLPCGPSPADARESVLARADLFKDVTAVLAANDRIAIEAMSGMAMLGLRVPEDCSVIGFDNVEFAEATHPRLTSFDPRGEEAGATAARMVLDLIDGKEVETVTIQPELTERESAGPCRKS